MLISNKIWEFRQQNDSQLEAEIASKFNLCPLTAKVILNRGINTDEEIMRFLEPSIKNFYDPFLLKDMSKAVKRITDAISGNEKIVIYGDYDVDGITSTSILLSYLSKFSKNIDFYIPDRIEEGYGLSINSIDKLISKGVNLIVTVDCGITAVEEVEYIKKNGIDVIITDHHECKDVIPSALAIVNPKQKDCTYPFKELAGVGVVFKLVQALAQKMKVRDVIDEYIEIVALGTVADVVPLLDENRIIVRHGLKKIVNTQSQGIKALINISGLHGKPITTTSIGYILAPRINAAGRIGDARKGVALFLCTDKEEAEQIAIELDQDNKNRQQTENIILNEALEMVANDPEMKKQKILVLASEGWHHGVIGIVASRITEKFHKPAILISLDGEDGKGSGRSISSFNLFEALMHCAPLLGKFGGHELAVGLSLSKENISQFRKEINDFADAVLSEEDFCPKVKIDGEISKDDVNLFFSNQLKTLEPFGIGNPCPVFLYNGLKIIDCKTVGEDKHIKLRMEDEGLYIDSIGFNLGELAPKLDIFDKVDVVCAVETNVWNGQEKMQLNIKDVRTNYDIIFKEKYYSTLENAIFNQLKTDGEEKDFRNNVKIFDGNILSLMENGQKNIVLINTLEGAKSFVDTLKKARMHEKQILKLFYNYEAGNNQAKNIAIINPYINKIKLSQFDNVIMYDLCFSKNQYEYLLRNSKNVYIMNNFIKHSNNADILEQIIPNRDDLIKVYQHIKSRGWNQSIQEDIFSLTREISLSYNIEINSLKLKKIFEVFQEMNLIMMDYEEENYNIKIIKQSGAKVNIQASKGLSKLLELKDEFDYFVNYMKQSSIC